MGIPKQIVVLYGELGIPEFFLLEFYGGLGGRMESRSLNIAKSGLEIQFACEAYRFLEKYTWKIATVF